MKTDIKELEINGTVYVPKSAQQAMAVDTDGLEYCIVRGDRSGVFAGYLKSIKDRTAELVNVRRIWYWKGAASISQLANDGTSDPNGCQFPAPNAIIRVYDVIEIIPATEKARLSIEGVHEWKK